MFENKKVCTNWVRRILLTDVAYDIIKVFRQNNESFRRAKLESYIQFQIKKGAKESVLLNFFKSRVDTVFMFKSYANSSLENLYHFWLGLNKSKVAMTTIDVKEVYSNEVNYNKGVSNSRLFLKNVLTSSKREQDFLSPYSLPYYDSFRIRSFQPWNAAWEVSDVVDSTSYKRLFHTQIGKLRGYRHILYSSGPQFKESIITRIIYIRRKMLMRLAFRYKVLNILCKLFNLKGITIKKNMINFLEDLSYNNYIMDKSTLSIFLHLCVKFNRERLLKVINLLRVKNSFDYSQISYTKYSFLGKSLYADKLCTALKSYQNFFVSHNDIVWIMPYLLKKSILGTSDVINMLSGAYYNTQAELRYEDFYLNYNTKLDKYIFSNFLKLYTSRGMKFFVKWYYLYLIKNKYRLLSPSGFSSLEHKRRFILRSLELFTFKGTSSKSGYRYLLKYLCEGSLGGVSFSLGHVTNIIKFRQFIKYSTRLTFFNDNNIFSRVAHYPMIPLWYHSYNKFQSYNLQSIHVSSFTNGMYTVYYNIFNELRMAYLLYKNKYFLQFTLHNKLLFIDLFYYLRYRIMHRDIHKYIYITTNINYSIYFYKSFAKLVEFDVGMNYNLLSSFVNGSFLNTYSNLNYRNLSSVSGFYEKMYDICFTLGSFMKKNKNEISFLNSYFHKFFPSLSFAEFEFSMWYALESSKNIKLFDNMVYSRELEWYAFVDGEDDELHRCGLRGSYMTRPILCIFERNLPVPSMYTLYYSIYKFYFYVYFSKLTLRYYHNNHFLTSWGFFIYKMFFRLREFNAEIFDFEEDISVYKRAKFADDDFFYGFDVYKHLFNGIRRWRTFRRQTVFIKNREYLFLLNSRSNYLLDKIEISLSLNVPMLYGYDSILEKSFVHKKVILESGKTRLIMPKNFYKKRHNFKGYGDYNTLQYISELTDENVGELTRGNVGSSYSDNFVFECLIRGDELHHDRYLDEYRFYTKRYKTYNSFLENYFIEISSLYNMGIDVYSKLGRYIDESKEVKLKRMVLVEDNIKDSRDFFNPVLDLYTLKADVDDLDNFIHTRVGMLYILYMYNPSIFYFNSSFFPYSYEYFGNSTINSQTVSLEYDRGIVYNSLYYSKLNYYTKKSIKENVFSDLLNFNFKEFIEVSDFKFLYILEKFLNFENSIDMSAALNMVKLYDVSNYSSFRGVLDYNVGLKSKFLLQMSTLLRLDIGSNNIISSRGILGNNIESLKDFYLHISYFDFNSLDVYRHSQFWIMYIWYLATASKCSYYRHKKNYYLWWLLYNSFKQSTNMSIDYYTWFLKKFNIYNMGFLDSLDAYKASNQVLSKAFINQNIIRYFDECLILNRWLHYWVSFFKFKISNINFVLLLRYLFDKFTMKKINNDISIREPSIKIIKYMSVYNRRLRLQNSIFASLFELESNFIGINYNVCTKGYVYRYVVFFFNQLMVLRSIKMCSGKDLCVSLYMCIIYRYICTWLFTFKNYLYDYAQSYTRGNFLYNNYLLQYYKLNKLVYTLLYSLDDVPHDDYLVALEYNFKKINIFSSRTKIITLLDLNRKISEQYLFYIYIYAVPYMRSYSTIFSNFDVITSPKIINNTFMLGGLYFSKLFSTWGIYTGVAIKNRYVNSRHFQNIRIYRSNYVHTLKHTYADYLAMFEHQNPDIDELVNIVSWYSDHYHVKFESRRYYSKFWYRYVPRDIIHIQRYRRFQQEIRRLIANRKKLRTGIIYRRLLIFKLVPGVFKEWHKLHVRRPYTRERFEDRVRFFYILKYKYHITKRRLMSSLYNRFNSTYTLHKAYHLLYFRLDNILFKLNFVPTFHFLRNSWILKFWNISINTISDVSYVQKSLIVGDIFFFKSGLHIVALNFRKIFHIENNLYLVYLLWFRLEIYIFDLDLSVPTEALHTYLCRIYLWYWYRFFDKNNIGSFVDYEAKCKYFYYKMMPYGFWAHNFLKFKEFKRYMVINSIDNYVRWAARSMCGFVYKEPSSGFFYGLHYDNFYRKESGSYGGHLRHSSVYK